MKQNNKNPAIITLTYIIEITEKVGNTAEERIKFASPLGEYMLIGGIYSTQL